MDDCVNGLSKGDSMEKILEEMREKSDRILRTDFLVRGYGTPERVKRNRVEKKRKEQQDKTINTMDSNRLSSEPYFNPQQPGTVCIAIDRYGHYRPSSENALRSCSRMTWKPE